MSGAGSVPGGPEERVTLELDNVEAHDLHHAISIAVQLLQEVGAQPGAALTVESEGRLARVARRLDHDRRHHGRLANPHALASRSPSRVGS